MSESPSVGAPPASGAHLRRQQEEWELVNLSPHATRSRLSRGRAAPIEECPVRTCFQRDRDRIIHSKAFRRLKYKTQVFIAPVGDHYRTRMTHTLEISQIARTIARALRLNEDLTEAIVLGHDLGHTPFGHSGEAVLNKLLPQGFRHYEHSVRIVELIEPLNLTWEVRQGMGHHTGNPHPVTLEAQVMKIADRIAYLNHDIDDAIRGGIITLDDVPAEFLAALGRTHGERINTLVVDIIENSWGQDRIRQSTRVAQAMDGLRNWMFQHVYIGSVAKQEDHKVERILKGLFNYYHEHPRELAQQIRREDIPAGELTQHVVDYIAGMTDRFALTSFQKLMMPSPWLVAEGD